MSIDAMFAVALVLVSGSTAALAVSLAKRGLHRLAIVSLVNSFACFGMAVFCMYGAVYH